MTTFPTYPEYKESGVEWLGKVPAHWNHGKVRYFSKLESGHTPSRNKPEYWENCTVPWFTLSDVWQIRSGLTNVVHETKEKISELGLANSSARLLPSGTVILSRTASVGYSAILGKPMATTQDFANWICAGEVQPEYLLAVFRAMKPEFSRMMMGSTHKTIYMPDIAELHCAIPPMREQSKIICFLDHETARIDALIDEQKRLIELLKEKRQAVISHAVTKGLDPDVPMKDSGVEWLGEVPAHWEVIKLGLITSEKCDGPFGSALKSEHYTDYGVRVVRLQNIRSGYYNDTDSAYIDEEYYKGSIAKSDVVSGDLLVAGLGDERNVVGRACVAPAGIEPAMVKADCFRFRLIPGNASPNFIAEQLSSGSEADAGVLASGSTRSRIPLSTMSTRKIALPPWQEQLDIYRYVIDIKHAFDLLSQEAKLAISLLQERRSALISDAVTGKIDVRNWQSEQSTEQSKLPMVAEAHASYR